jgi:hypothetical protein
MHYHHHHVHEGVGLFPLPWSLDEVSPSISSSVVLCSFVFSIYIVVLDLVSYLCPSSVRVVATFLVPFYFLYYVLCSRFFTLSGGLQWYMSYRVADSLRAHQDVPSWSCCVYSKKTPDDWQRNCPKHVEIHSKNKFEKSAHLVGFIVRIQS